MKKQRIQLLVAGILLILVAAAYIGMRYYNSQPKEETTETYVVTQDELAAVTQFSFSNENGSFTFVKTEDGWRYEADPEFSVDTTVLEGIIEKAVALSSENKIEAVEDMSQYGLTEPEITISYQTAEGSKTLYIGEFNSAVYVYYLTLEGSDTVYTVEGAFRGNFTKTLEDLESVEVEETETTADDTTVSQIEE